MPVSYSGSSSTRRSAFNPISEFYNFSSMIFALLFLFASLRLDAGWPTRRLLSRRGGRACLFLAKVHWLLVQ